MYNLYNLINDLREKRGITNYRLCKETGIQPSVLTDLKMGRQSGLSAKNINKVAEYFGVSVGYLLGEKNIEENYSTKKPVQDDIILDELEFALFGEIRELKSEEKQELLRMARRMRELENFKKQQGK